MEYLEKLIEKRLYLIDNENRLKDREAVKNAQALNHALLS